MDLPYYAVRFKKSGHWLTLVRKDKKENPHVTPEWAARTGFLAREEAESWRDAFRTAPKKIQKKHGKPVIVKVVRYVRPTVPKFRPWADQLQVVTDAFGQSGFRHHIHVFGRAVDIDIADRLLTGKHGVPERINVQVVVGDVVVGGIHLRPSGEVALVPRSAYTRGYPDSVRRLCEEIIEFLRTRAQVPSTTEEAPSP